MLIFSDRFNVSRQIDIIEQIFGFAQKVQKQKVVAARVAGTLSRPNFPAGI